jgi:hypothetical protein
MLHASAVKLEDGVLLFLGDSGAGKSTLAGNFHQAGNPVLSDDCLWIKDSADQIKAIPTYGGLRLWDDSLQVLFSSEHNIYPVAHYSSKKRVALQRDGGLQSGTGMPVLAVIALSPPGHTSTSEIILERLPNREAFVVMLKQTFQLNVLDIERMTRHMEALGRIVPRLPAFRLSMPHKYDLLPATREKIVKAVLL